YSLQYCPPGTAGLPPGALGTHLVLSDYSGTRPSIINSSAPIFPLSPTNPSFRFVRKPRPMTGEPPLQLPKDLIVDLGLPQAMGGSVLVGATIPGADDPLDIL